MSDFGMKCWDAQGRQTLDLTDTISRLRFQTVAGTDQSGSIYLPDIVGKQSVGFAISVAIPPAAYQATTFPQGYHAHYVTVNGSKVSWEPQGLSHKPNATSNIIVFLYT